MDAPDTGLTVYQVLDVLHTGISHGCMASNGAKATSALRIKLFSGK